MDPLKSISCFFDLSTTPAHATYFDLSLCARVHCAATNAELISHSEAAQALHVSATLHAGVPQVSTAGLIILPIVVAVTTACAKKTGAAARESLQRDRPGGLTLPAFHACGSASLLSARTFERSGRMTTPIVLPVRVRILRMASNKNTCKKD